ncbi:MAG: type 1 glutamine amidotransferase [Litorimonas sp.]
MKIGILQAGRAPDSLQSEHGDYNEMSQVFLGLPSANVQHYAVLDGEFPDSVSDCDGWFITGSRFGVYEGHDWIAPLEAFVRSAHAENRKMVGICFGHQIMAQALGGRVVKYDKGFSVGAVDYTLTGSLAPADEGASATTRLNAYHQDQVETPPDAAELILTSDFCHYAGFAYGDWGLSVQPHPEFEGEYLKELVAERRGTLLSNEISDEALLSLETPAQKHFQGLIRTFFGL